MARKRPSAATLRAASGVLHDEVRRLTVLVNGVISPTPHQSLATTEALTTAFLAHMLNLVHFLHPVRPKAGDLLAEDFFSSAGQWEKVRLPMSERLSDGRKHAQESFARLTIKAPEAVESMGQREVLELANEISAGISVFLSHVPKKHLGEKWERFRRQND